MNISRTAILRTGTLSALAGLALMGSAQAGVINQNVNIPTTKTDFTKTFTFNQFDTLGGTRVLDSVELSPQRDRQLRRHAHEQCPWQ